MKWVDEDRKQTVHIHVEVISWMRRARKCLVCVDGLEGGQVGQTDAVLLCNV